MDEVEVSPRVSGRLRLEIAAGQRRLAERQAELDRAQEAGVIEKARQAAVDAEVDATVKAAQVVLSDYVAGAEVEPPKRGGRPKKVKPPEVVAPVDVSSDGSADASSQSVFDELLN